MLQSNQINNENSFPPIKSIPLNSQGKVRVLSFDVSFATKSTEAKEDILLVKLPKNNIKIIQIGLTALEAEGTFDLINSNITYSNVNNKYTIIKDSAIKSAVSFTSTGSSVLNINETVSAPVEVNSDNYIKIQASIPFTKANAINGYVLYIAD